MGSGPKFERVLALCFSSKITRLVMLLSLLVTQLKTSETEKGLLRLSTLEICKSNSYVGDTRVVLAISK